MSIRFNACGGLVHNVNWIISSLLGLKYVWCTFGSGHPFTQRRAAPAITDYDVIQCNDYTIGWVTLG